MRELAYCIRVELVDTSKGLLPDGLLVVGEQESAELSPLEEVLPMVFCLRHRQQVLMHTALILIRNGEFHG